MSLRDKSNNPPTTHPKGWEPSITWDGTTGEVSSGPLESEPNDAIWGEIVADWGVTNNVRIIPGSVQIRAWDAFANGQIQRMRYYRARLEPNFEADDRDDVEELCEFIAKRKPLTKTETSNADEQRALVILLSDWQVGKGEGGGSKVFLERLLGTYDRLVLRAKELSKQGITTAYVVGLGDLVEQCDGHYAMQAFQADLDRREQMRLARRLILDLVDRLIKLNMSVVLGAVPGNHGENRRNGKAFTTWTDNDDLALFDQVGEILSHNPERYKNVSVPLGAIAEDLTMTLDVCGTIIGFAHGHQITGAGGPGLWWTKQSHGKQPIGKADLLCVGHKHHLAISEASGRTWFQAPAMDNGSYWWTAKQGASSPSGLLTFVAGTNCGERGWQQLEII